MGNFKELSDCSALCVCQQLIFQMQKKSFANKQKTLIDRCQDWKPNMFSAIIKVEKVLSNPWQAVTSLIPERSETLRCYNSGLRLQKSHRTEVAAYERFRIAQHCHGIPRNPCVSVASLHKQSEIKSDRPTRTGWAVDLNYIVRWGHCLSAVPFPFSLYRFLELLARFIAW